MYEFYSNSAVYSASLPLNSFSTWDCYYFEFSLVLRVKVLLIKKDVTLFIVSWTWRNNFLSWVYFCVSPAFHWGRYYQDRFSKLGLWNIQHSIGDVITKKDFQNWKFGKRHKEGDDNIDGVVYRRDVQTIGILW